MFVTNENKTVEWKWSCKMTCKTSNNEKRYKRANIFASFTNYGTNFILPFVMHLNVKKQWWWFEIITAWTVGVIWDFKYYHIK